MKQVREQLDPFGHPGTGASEIGIRVDSDHSRTSRRRQRARGINRLGESIAARRDDDNLRRASRY